MEHLGFQIFVTALAIAGLYVAWVCGNNDGCKINPCFRKGAGK